MYIYCQKISNLFVRALETCRKKRAYASFSGLSRSKYINYIMYVYGIYPVMSKSPNQLPNLIKISRSGVHAKTDVSYHSPYNKQVPKTFYVHD